ncbi:mitochondrial Cox1 translation regulator Ppr4 [Schizosaccharomyces osmophilus]|uniref:Mitochondrial Cox1 translation regulator Ppr4 n=1 Tax=Schizosaccharomyces osmophilus TaxID=2545709 RepID=A0AAE9WFI5_9SCHI|nr:mitochondrial Cox1 translation regulator Ppr4 [Schizosaccharomyces osmophilus]WBW73838.1 mitochondrial Cox1 translation regulator Ppr4 [Schizosaccharomyces osmophilus]
MLCKRIVSLYTRRSLLINRALALTVLSRCLHTKPESESPSSDIATDRQLESIPKSAERKWLPSSLPNFQQPTSVSQEPETQVPSDESIYRDLKSMSELAFMDPNIQDYLNQLSKSNSPWLSESATFLQKLAPYFYLPPDVFLEKANAYFQYRLLKTSSINHLAFAISDVFYFYFKKNNNRGIHTQAQKIIPFMSFFMHLNMPEYVFHLYIYLPKDMSRNFDITMLNNPFRKTFARAFSLIENPLIVLRSLNMTGRNTHRIRILYLHYLHFLLDHGEHQKVVALSHEIFNKFKWIASGPTRLLMNSYHQQSQFNAAVQVYNEVSVKSDKVESNTILLRELLKVVTSAGYYNRDSFHVFLKTLLKMGYIPSLQIFARLLTAVAKYHMPEVLYPLMNQYRTQFNNMLTPSVFVAAVKAVVYCGDINTIKLYYQEAQASEEIKNLKHLFNLFITSTTVSLDASMAMNLLRAFKDDKSLIDKSTLVSCITLFSRRKDLDAMEKVYKYITDLGVSTPPEGYAALLDAYIEAANEKKIQSCLQKIEELGIGNNPSVNRMLMRYALYKFDYGLLQNCTAFAEKHDKGGRDYLYTIMMLYHTSVGEVRQALNVFSTIRKPNVVHFSIVVTVLGNLKELDQIKFLEERMSSLGIQMTPLSLTAFVTSYCKQGTEGLAEAERYMKSVFQTKQRRASIFNARTANDLRYPVSLFSPLIREYTSLGDMTEAKNVLALYLDYHLKNITSQPDIPFAIASMQLYCSLHDTLLARRFWDLILQVARQNFMSTKVELYISDKKEHEDEEGKLLDAYKGSLNMPAEIYFSFLASVNAFQELNTEWLRLRRWGAEFDEAMFNKRIVWILYSGRIDMALTEFCEYFLSKEKLNEHVEEEESISRIANFLLSYNSPVYTSTWDVLREKLAMANENGYVRSRNEELMTVPKYFQQWKQKNELLYTILSRL